MKALVLRLDAPMLSFGTTAIDHLGFTDYFPGTALLTGLIGNALGWEHRDFDKLQRLQERLRYAARWDIRPVRMVDYQTVDLGQPKMAEAGWTTRGKPEHRTGGSAKKETHQRYRHYWTDGLMTVVLTLLDEEEPDLNQIAQALRRPSRPLFLGRKSCLPSRPLLDPHTPIVEGEDLLEILRRVPRWVRSVGKDSRRHTGSEDLLPACWPDEIGTPSEIRGELKRVFDLRDWKNQLPAGSRWRMEGVIDVKESIEVN
ncbi:type I-E CRISPR-associated protein Cas5/CasD [Brockia lithotrophica]|uniref:CRISPR-associated Cas5e family protein n=1 Tax=Brockia lithotrophica TaxID=933949 RepID=A0A660KW74_9BACL|nr:type I-E CRISPR-associated protein Cas5/CasD [Brockia lithotrophica]RKQ84263.1 CRISPR-associated Cas5e family protein [Brockia lithotrophica]